MGRRPHSRPRQRGLALTSSARSRRGIAGRARRVQLQLERVYGLEPAPDVRDYLRVDARRGARERLLVRHDPDRDEVELSLHLPACAAGARTLSDAGLQLVEGVSHFVYLAERARRDLPTTRLELELQAEVDKFVLAAEHHAETRQLTAWLFRDVTFVHVAESEEGARYRAASDLAARFAAQLARRARPLWREVLRRFYGEGQRGKLELISAQAA